MALSGVLVSLGTIVAIYGLLAIGLNIKFGYGGLLEIGHVAFYLVGAYATALLVLPPSTLPSQQFATYVLGLNWPWLPALAVGTAAAGVFGMLVALPAIRLREDYLAIAVLGISAIAKRIIQTQSWLANGPTSLKGWSAPLDGPFPLPGEGVAGAVVLGVVVFALWALMPVVIDRIGVPGAANPGTRRRVAHGLVGLTTLGVGYVAARRIRREDGLEWWVPAASGGLAGGIATAAAIVGAGELAILVLVGLASLFTWVALGIGLANHYEAMSARGALMGLGLAVAFLVVFLPVIVLGGEGGDAMSSVGLLVTLLLLVGFLYGLYRLATNWSAVGTDAEFVSVIGVAAAWLFGIRYFLLSLIGPFKRAGIGGAIANLIQNVLWLVSFTPAGAAFDYSRFFLLVTVGVVAGAYLLSEITVRSPFGRVLKAIREDEDVAMALGKNTFVYKVQSMILGSALAGLAGGLAAIYFGSLVHTMFAPRVTFTVLLMVIIGGVANNRGVLLGAVIFWAFQRGTTDLAGFFPTDVRSSIQALRLAFIGALLIVILYYRPEGIWGEERMTAAQLEE